MEAFIKIFGSIYHKNIQQVNIFKQQIKLPRLSWIKRYYMRNRPCCLLNGTAVIYIWFPINCMVCNISFNFGEWKQEDQDELQWRVKVDLPIKLIICKLIYCFIKLLWDTPTHKSLYFIKSYRYNLILRLFHRLTSERKNTCSNNVIYKTIQHYYESCLLIQHFNMLL